MTHIENEVEPPRDESFGVAASRREREIAEWERRYGRVYKIGMVCILAVAFVWTAYHAWKPAQPYVTASGQLVMTCELDHAEKCSVCTFTDSQGRVRHKNTHCPALEASGLMRWPVGEKP